MSRITADSDWYQPPLGADQVRHNALLIKQELMPKGWKILGCAGVAAWARCLSILNPAYTGTGQMPTGRSGFGLLSFDTSSGFHTALLNYGYSTTSGGGQLDTLDRYGYNMLVNIGSNDPVYFFNQYIRANASGAAYQQVNRLWMYLLSGFLGDWVSDTYRSMATEYCEEYLELFKNPSPWLYFEMSKRKKGGSKLYL